MKWLKTYKIFESKSSLKFVEQPTKKGAKTETYNVIKNGEVIGQIKWSSKMRGYAFLPEKQHDVEIKNFIKDLMSKRKKSKLLEYKTNGSTEESESKEYITQTVKDILLPISDMGYDISVVSRFVSCSFLSFELIIRVVSYSEPILKMDDVKDEFIRMFDYLESEGFSSIEAHCVRSFSHVANYSQPLPIFRTQMKIDFNEFISMENCELRNLLFVAKKIK